ncbi:hypothetical protein MFLAVUS_004483 [Mucor flavus]|uniref:Uncharacterized protein n=1 Tax=Mucor flavus TaxID=439312 RepID=A0ABP9YW54_9FUNG
MSPQSQKSLPPQTIQMPTDIESKTDENSVLQAKILTLEEELSSKNEQTVSLMNTNEYLKTRETKRLNNQVKELEQEVEDLNTKLEETEAENEKLDMANLALKMELDDKVEELDEKEEVPDLSSKVEELQNMLKKANKALSERPPDLSSLVKELQGRLDKANKALAEERNEYSLKVQELRSKALDVTRNLAEQLSTNTISPVFMNKIKKLKANYTNLKNENQFLKEQIKKKDSIILNSQNLEDMLQSSSDDDTEYIDVDISTHSSSNSSNNKARANQLNKINTPPPPRPARRSSSKSSDYSLNESFLSFDQRTPLTDKSPSAPAPVSSPPRAQTPRRTSSASSKSSSSSAVVRGSLAKPKISTNNPYILDLDAYSPTHDSSAPISPTERVATASALKERPIASAKGAKAETSSRIISPLTGKAAYRTAGLEPPAPQIFMPSSVASAKTKKPKSKLAKFVNSRNPSKIIDSRPLISHTTAKKRALSPERPVPKTSLASRPASERSAPSAATAKPVISTPSVAIAKRVISTPSAAITKSVTSPLSSISSRYNAPASTSTEVLRTEESASKRTKMDTHYVDVVKGWVNSKYVVSSDDFNEKKISDCLEEIKLNFTSMKSPSDPDSKGDVRYGIDDSFWIEVPNKMDAKEKAYALLLSLAINKKPELLNRIYNTLYGELKASLKSKRSDTSCARYSRLLCTIGKSAKELERIRVVCYDIIRHSTCPKNTIMCLYNISAGWKDVLTITSTDNMIMEALRVCCNVIAHDKKTPANIKGMYEKMARTCNWKNTTENVSLDTAISNVFNELVQLGEETDKGN